MLRFLTPGNDIAEEERWRYFYILQDEILAIIFVPFGFRLDTYLLVANKLFKEATKITLIVSALVFIVHGLANLGNQPYKALSK